MNPITKSFTLSDGRVISLETGKLAKQADGSAVIRLGNTMLLATVVSDRKASDNIDFMPLTVEYRENFASIGKIPGGFFKREGRPSDTEILISRLIDRALRPLFPGDYHASTVVTVNLISSDGEDLPDALAGFAAAAALAVSDIPFEGPVSEVRVARIAGKLCINPTKTALLEGPTDIDLIVAGTANSILMVEGEMKEVQEAEMVDAIALAHEEIKRQCALLSELEAATGNQVKRTYEHEKKNPDLNAQMRAFCFDRCAEVAAMGLADKHKRSELFKGIKDEFVATLSEEVRKENEFLIGMYFHKLHKEAVRKVMLEKKIRLDGRKMDEIRPIWSEVDYLPGPHGSSLFTRGETQSLTTVTLGTALDTQMVDGVIFEGELKFLLHYNFPSFSTGEARAPRGTSRREVGHGNLALRALKNMIPTDNPYTIRVVSDILESNGSSSMATVCAGSLALMDAGVKIRKPVSGIAMGLISHEASGQYVVLSDILGDEDHLGDMDFKVTGTADGITACQMDLKLNGLSKELLMEALEQARRGRLHILSKMNETMSAPREDYKPHAPRVEVIVIDKEFIGAVIGPQGKIIQEIQAESGTTINIEEKDNKGYVEIYAVNKDSIEKARRRIQGIVAVPEVGEVYDATVKSIMPYGAFMEFLPGKQGLLHISEISHKRIESMEGIFQDNEVVKVKLVGVDPKTGKYKLSRKALMERESGAAKDE